MVFAVQKLRNGIEQLERATVGPSITLSPLYSTPAAGPMAPPPPVDAAQWQQVEGGQTWGQVHGTSWLMTTLQAPEEMQRQPLVLQLHWITMGDDSLLLQLEATAFLDGRASGAFDWRHPVLLLPEEASDGQPHLLTIQVYTYVPLLFDGLTLRPRHMTKWKLHQLMQTLLEVYLTLDENDIAAHALLERLNTAYTLLDLREGWQSERFAASAQQAYGYLQTSLEESVKNRNRPHITVSGHAHLDVGWMWPFWRTRQKIAHTISNVLALMERYPHYYYSQSQPQVLQWLKEDRPDIYARVKERVAEGRFELVGAMWLEADCNLTSGESLIRQVLHGTHFTQQEFGFTPRHIWLPDVFGYSAALPQIMRGCDLPVFMTTKISWNQFNRMPCDTFRWRGIDGSEVLTHFITSPNLHPGTTFYTYNGPLRPSDMTGIWKNYRQQNINDQLLYLAGWGDGGGGPTEQQLEDMQVMADLPEFPTVHGGRVDEYFEALYQRVWNNSQLPTWVGELYLEYHRGTYTSQAKVKQANRRAELFYREVELLNAWASTYGMASYQEQLNQGWRLILLNQFHDVLPGSSIHEVYDDAERIYAEARSLGERVRDAALDVLRDHFAAREQDLLLLNSLPWERTDPIQLPARLAPSLQGTQQTTDWNGEPLLLLDGIPVPSCGLQLVTAASIMTESETSLEQPCRATRLDNGVISLQNTYYDLTIDAQGEISRLYDKRAERDVLAPGQSGNQLIAYEDRPLNFDAWDIDLFYEEKPYFLHEATIRLIEEGPIRTTVEIMRPYMSSRVTQRLSLWRSSPRIDFATEIDWHEHQTLLKATFPLDVNSMRATYEIQFGNVERPTHRNTSWDLARFEVCAHRWVDLSEGGYGVSLLNDSKYGHDIHDNIIRLTLLKSGVYPDPDADQGIHHFTYSLLPHLGNWREAETVRRAYELNVPISGMNGMKHAPTTASEQLSFLQVDATHVVVETVKPAEDGDGLIVRLYEAYNQRGDVSLSFASPITSARECNLLETPTGDVSYQGNTLHFQVRPFEIKTFRVHLAPARQTG